jgi:hypothetical protein
MNDHIYYTGIEKLKNNMSFYDLENSPEGWTNPVRLTAPAYLSYGDYDNSCMIERANYRAFLERFKDYPGVYTASGAYHSYAILLTDKALENKEIKECIDALHDYPVIDDELVSNMTFELETQLFEEDYKHEIVKYINKVYEVEIDAELKKDQLFELYRELQERNNEYFEVEAGGIGYIDIGKLLASITKADLTAFKLD